LSTWFSRGTAESLGGGGGRGVELNLVLEALTWKSRRGDYGGAHPRWRRLTYNTRALHATGVCGRGKREEQQARDTQRACAAVICRELAGSGNELTAASDGTVPCMTWCSAESKWNRRQAQINPYHGANHMKPVADLQLRTATATAHHPSQPKTETTKLNRPDGRTAEQHRREAP
jgi:hypothetical protein